MPIPPAPVRAKTNVLTIQEEDMFLWKVAGIQVSLQACHGLLQEKGEDMSFP